MAVFSLARAVRAAVNAERPAAPHNEAPLVPGSLRAFDPGVAAGLIEGHVASSSGTFRLGAPDPFDVPALSTTALRELASFDWLRHLSGSNSVEAEDVARRLLLAWPESMVARSAPAREPMVRARRAVTLLAHADIGMAGASRDAYDMIAALVAAEFTSLARDWARWPLSHARLTAAIAITAYHVSRFDARALAQWERSLAAEIDRQILADGGHMSRNPAAVLDLAIDLLPLRRLYVAAGRPVPGAIGAALTRLQGMLRFLQHTDHQLARFNGMGATPAADLSSVLLQLHGLTEARLATGSIASASRYVRCEAGACVLIFDAGPQEGCVPGDTPFAGALSFELSSGRAPLFANAGADAAAAPACRTTAAHSALVLADTPSAPLSGGRSGITTAALDPRPAPDDPYVVRASSTCYRERFGFTHERTLTLAADGLSLTGRDVLVPREAATIPDHPFTIHLRLHPSVYVDLEATTPNVRLTTADGARWRVSAIGAVPSIESGTFHASTLGSRPTLQIVLAGRTGRVREVTWRVERIEPPTISAAG